MVGFNPALAYSAGTVGKELLKVENLPVNVKDFGATGDGVTDDTAAIQAAIDSLTISLPSQNRSGGTVFFPVGNYKISSITVGSGVSIVGSGTKSTRLFSVGAATMINYAVPADTNQPRNLISGILFDGGGTSGSGGSRVTNTAINVNGLNSATIRDCSFTRFAAASIISTTLVVDLVVDRCFFYSNYRAAQHTGGNATTIRYVHCYISFSDDAGITCADIMEAYFDNCLFEKCGRPGAYISQTSNATVSFRKCYFEQNNLLGPATSNLELNSCLAAVVDDCHFVAYGGAAVGSSNIFVGAGTQRCDIKNAFFSTAPAAGTSYNIAGDAGANRVTVSNDVHYGAGGWGKYSPTMLTRIGSFPQTSSPAQTILSYYDERNYGETGTVVPTVYGATTAGVTTYQYQYGQWTRIGRVIFFNLQVKWLTATGTGAILIGGLPFTCKTGPIPAVNVGQMTISTASSMPSGTISQGAPIISLTQYSAGSTVVVPMTGSGEIYISGHYMTD